MDVEGYKKALKDAYDKIEQFKVANKDVLEEQAQLECDIISLRHDLEEAERQEYIEDHARYRQYRLNCYFQGDIWNQDNIPYSFERWKEEGKPENGGIPIKNVIHKDVSKHA